MVNAMGEEFLGDGDFSAENFDDSEAEGNEFENYSAEDVTRESQIVDLEDVKVDRIVVNGWRTKAHGATVGIRQKEQWQARSRKMTDSMVIKGKMEFYDIEYIPDGEKTKKNKKKIPRDEIFALNSFFWRTDEKSALFKKYGSERGAKMNRKLIIKSFINLDDKDPNSGRWVGSIEQSLVDSLCQTFGEKHDGMPCFIITTPGIPYQIRLNRTHSIIGEEFTFPIIDYKTGETRVIMLTEKRFTPGKDFDVVDAASGIHLATLDDRKGDLGGKVVIDFDTETALGAKMAKNFLFRRVLALFSACISYLDDTYKTMELLRKTLSAAQKVKKIKDDAEREARLKEMIEKGEYVEAWKITEHEKSMHFNPRRVRM
ncbi:MAG: hypothetical protein ACTSU5_02975 [Promethearchaeota archaeon]